MNFKIFQRHLKCHEINENNIFFTRNNEIIVKDYTFKTLYSHKIDNNCKFLFRHYFLSKILRNEIFNLFMLGDKFVFSYKSKIFQKSMKENYFFKGFRGSRPLRILNDHHNNKLLFGEYFSNKDRNEVNIFCKNSYSKWTKAYTFKPGLIRHIHNIVYDTYNKKYIVMTGDSDSESNILSFNLNLTDYEIISNGSQMSRAIDIIPTAEGYVVPTDSPINENFIYFLDKKGNIKSKSSVNGSVFHLCKYEDFFLATTALEPSKVNCQSFVYLYASFNGLDWVELKKFKKKYPLFLSKLLRYPEIELTKKIDKSFNFIPFYFRNIYGFVDGTYFLNKKEIVKKIKCEIL